MFSVLIFYLNTMILTVRCLLWSLSILRGQNTSYISKSTQPHVVSATEQKDRKKYW